MNFIHRFRQLALDFQIIFIVLLLITIGSLVFAFRKAQSPKIIDSQAVAAAEIKSIVAELGKVMVLPQNETPTLATVKDPEVLKDQPFFAHAMEGDKVLIYTNAHKAILWRPSTHKIIEVSELASNNVNTR